MKEIIGKNETLETHLLKKLLIDKGTITDQRQIANKFNGFFFNWDSLHARLNSHYKAWSYKKKKHKKIKVYRKSV